jgi:dTDP-4-amino-4,6-dideoxygalactose transaminase
VTADGKDRWKSIRLRDAIPIVKHIRWGLTTSPGSAFVEFEQEFAHQSGCKFGLSMNSGTAALHSGLFAVGVGPGDEVIVPSYTYHATVSAVLCCGATPVFGDIDPRSLTLDPRDIVRRITPRTKAVIAVHVWGNPAEMDSLSKLARDHQIALIEDCSHAHGASFQGRPVGSWGEIGCFSLQGAKAVSAGEGGIAVCSDARYFDRMLALGQPVRVNGHLKSEKYDLGLMNVGPKYRPHLFGVLLAQSSLRRLPELNRRRRRNWEILRQGLADCDAIEPIQTLPQAEMGGFLEFKLILNTDRLTVSRDVFLQAAQAEGIPASADRYGFLHDAAIFRHGGFITLDCLLKSVPPKLPVPELPHTESLRERIITIPAFVDISEKFVKQCADGLKKVADAYRTTSDSCKTV